MPRPAGPNPYSVHPGVLTTQNWIGTLKESKNMRLQRFPIFSALTLTALILPSLAAAETPPDYRTLFDQGSAAYTAEDWPRCAEVFAKAADAATHDREAARAYFAAAACSAAKGDKDAAFAFLDKAAGKGHRDLERATVNELLEPLRQDPRWKTFLEGVKSRAAAHEATTNAELARLYREDQGDRESGPNGNMDGVSKRDAERRKRVLEIAGQGGLKVADDYFHHAAMVSSTAKRPKSTIAPTNGASSPWSSTL